jgi:hypothetical protein
MAGEGGVEGAGGVLCAEADALINNTIAKTVSRLLILMDRNPPGKIFQFHAGDERKFQKQWAVGSGQLAVKSRHDRRR